MFIDFTHNTVIKNTITEGFKSKFESGVMPVIREIYGNRLLGVQMYEDYISLDLSADGYWYYPLTVVLAEGHDIVWIRWSTLSASDFEGGVPYAFVGYSLDFEICDSVPEEISSKIQGSATYCPEGALKIQVHAAHPDKTFISGKYSQTFIDEMARQITLAISREMEVEGLSSSSVELSLAFAPDTYMEHTSENVTYRRLLLTAKGCSPRDFWIKWTRLDSASAYSVKDNVKRGSVVFEIGEDVPQKIREKEYRFLVYGNSDKYRVAMGRKTVVEWREIIKRALKRGELTKAEGERTPEAQTAFAPSDVSAKDTAAEIHSSEVSDKLLEILAKCGASVSSEAEDTYNTSAPAANPEFDEAMRIARAAAGITDDPVEEETEEFESMDLPGLELTVNSTPASYFTQDVDDTDSGTVLKDEDVVIEEEYKEEGITEQAEYNPDEEAFVTEERKAMPHRDSDSELVARLLKEAEELRLENQRLVEEARRAEESRRLAEEAKVAEAELRRRLEIEERAREREKILFAEAARQAQLENERRIKELEERDAARREAEDLAEAMRLEAEMKAAEEERVVRERARIEEEARYKALDREERERRAREARERMEAEAKAKANGLLGLANEPAVKQESVASDAPTAKKTQDAPFVPSTQPSPEYNYTSKLVRLMFRRPIDPNVTSRIHELISAALAYYHKEHIYIKVKAAIADSTTVVLNFVKIPEEELDLLVNIIKLLGNSDLGITKVILE